MLRIVDPYRGLLLHRHTDAVRAGMQSDAVAYIRWSIAEHLAEIEDNDDLEQDFTRGFRMGLRVAFLLAGGDSDGSEVDWAQVAQAGRG